MLLLSPRLGECLGRGVKRALLKVADLMQIAGDAHDLRACAGHTRDLHGHLKAPCGIRRTRAGALVQIHPAVVGLSVRAGLLVAGNAVDVLNALCARAGPQLRVKGKGVFVARDRAARGPVVNKGLLVDLGAGILIERTTPRPSSANVPLPVSM